MAATTGGAEVAARGGAVSAMPAAAEQQALDASYKSDDAPYDMQQVKEHQGVSTFRKPW